MSRSFDGVAEQPGRVERIRRVRRTLIAPLLALTAATMCPTAAPAGAAGDGECSVILPAADRLEQEFGLVSPSGTPSYVASQIRNALAPLHGLRSAAAVDLRLRSDMLASQVDGSDPYRPASPERLAGDLTEARQDLAAARDYCAP